ncbi:MAG TPA: c-type cytochrome [Bryobacteraceae bacterium]|nr:c-type cytochrome [Bryobacteraceae bacterium]
MKKLGWFLLGAVSLLAIEILAGYWISSRAHGWSTREEPMAMEGWISRRSRAAAIPDGAKERRNPIAQTPEVLADARAHWADHCASCHANDGSGEIAMGKHLYPPAPDMRRSDTQRLTDGELFYIVQNGIRLTGMPSWGGNAHDEEDSWKLVHFIRHLPEVTLEERKQMEKMNPKSPDEFREEEEEEKFLKGESTDEPQPHHHH